MRVRCVELLFRTSSFGSILATLVFYKDFAVFCQNITLCCTDCFSLFLTFATESFSFLPFSVALTFRPNSIHSLRQLGLSGKGKGVRYPMRSVGRVLISLSQGVSL